MARSRKQTKQPKPRKQIKRQTRKFQLRRDHPIDSHVAEILDYKRERRQEVTAIRDGVRLLWSLENNDLSVLFSMFPNLKPDIVGGGGGELLEIKSMLEIVVAGRKANELVMQSTAAPASTGKQIAGFKELAAPVEDEDMPAMVIQKTESNIGVANFLKQVASLKAAPPKAVAKKAREASADEIADNFLSMF